MARITLFWCFEKYIFLNRMMEFQVKLCYHSGLRLWKTGMLFSTKYKCHKSNFRISWVYRYNFYNLKVNFWCPNKCFFWFRLSLNTLYYQHSISLVLFKDKMCSVILYEMKNGTENLLNPNWVLKVGWRLATPPVYHPK